MFIPHFELQFLQNCEIGDILQLWRLCTAAPQPQDPGQQILWRRLSRWDWAGRCWSRPPHTRSLRSQAADTNTGAKRINRFSLILKSLIQDCVKIPSIKSLTEDFLSWDWLWPSSQSSVKAVPISKDSVSSFSLKTVPWSSKDPSKTPK